MSFSLAVKQRALDVGFDLVGIAPLKVWQDLEFSKEWVMRGFGGEMRYLENPKRHDPRLLLPSAQSVICVGLIYNAPLAYSTKVRNQESEVRSQKQGARQPSVVGRPLEKTSDNGPRTTEEGPRGWISRYAWGRDYHHVMRAKLEKLRRVVEGLWAGVETRVYVDTGPIVERAFARYSGIGWMGKNTCLINERKGSWFFLAVMLTNLALDSDLPAPDRCGSCTRCIEACPTGALVEPYVMDASRCIAYFNIELKGSVPEQFRSAMGVNVVGCDICQDVCPWNSKGRSQESGVRSREEDSRRTSSGGEKPTPGFGRVGAATTAREEFQPLQVPLPFGISNPGSGFGLPAPGSESRAPAPYPRTPDSGAPAPSPESRAPCFSLFHPPLQALASMTEEDFRETFRRSPLKRLKYRGWLRNLCVAMGNTADARFIPKLKELSQHADPVVREHAAWALARLQSL